MRRFLSKLLRRSPPVDAGVGDRAGPFYDQGYNCAQAILMATTGRDDAELLEICEAYGAGLQESGCLCGAVNGGVMALALCGKGKRTAELVASFRQRHRTTCCKGLTAEYKWNSCEHLASCRAITVATAEDVARLLAE